MPLIKAKNAKGIVWFDREYIEVHLGHVELYVKQAL